MNAQAALQSLWDRPFELLLAMEARLRDGDGVQNTPSVAKTWSGLAFTLGEQQFLAPQSDVSEVLELPEMTRVPRARPWLLGIANVRGDLLPVIDLGRLFGSEETHITDDSRVVVLNDDEVPAGFLVDGVGGFRSFSPEDQRHELLGGNTGNDVSKRFMLGVFVREGHTWQVLSLKKLVADPLFGDAGL